MAVSLSLAKSVIFNLCKAFSNASPSPSLRHSTKISRLSSTTSASNQYPSDGNGVDADRDPRADLAYEDAKERAKEGAEGMKEKAEEMAEEGRKKARETVQNVGEKAKETVEGAWEAGKETTSKIKESVVGSNEG